MLMVWLEIWLVPSTIGWCGDEGSPGSRWLPVHVHYSCIFCCLHSCVCNGQLAAVLRHLDGIQLLHS